MLEAEHREAAAAIPLALLAFRTGAAGKDGFDGHALAFTELNTAGAQRIDYAHHFVPGRLPRLKQVAVEEVKIRSAQTAGFDAYSALALAGCAQLAADHFQLLGSLDDRRPTHLIR
jgi:hypothetical protein